MVSPAMLWNAHRTDQSGRVRHGFQLVEVNMEEDCPSSSSRWHFNLHRVSGNFFVEYVGTDPLYDD